MNSSSYKSNCVNYQPEEKRVVQQYKVTYKNHSEAIYNAYDIKDLMSLCVNHEDIIKIEQVCAELYRGFVGNI